MINFYVLMICPVRVLLMRTCENFKKFYKFQEILFSFHSLGKYFNNFVIFLTSFYFFLTLTSVITHRFYIFANLRKFHEVHPNTYFEIFPSYFLDIECFCKSSFPNSSLTPKRIQENHFFFIHFELETFDLLLYVNLSV